MKNSRREAAFVVARWILTKDFPANLLPEGPDRGFVQDLVYTTIRRFRPLRKVLGELVKKWPKGELEALLYVGAAQVLYMPEVPDFAAVNETVEAAKACENRNVAKVVNGVLRNLIRRRGEFERLIAAAPADERESFPLALYRRWVARFGADGAERLAKWHNEPAETYLAYPDRFEKLARGRKVTEVEGYAEGKFIVQDPGTALAVELMDAHPGDEILDACAAPGGKTIQLAWRGAKVTACEVNPKRRRKLVENLKRAGIGSDRVGIGSDRVGVGSDRVGIGSDGGGVGSDSVGIGSDRGEAWTVAVVDSLDPADPKRRYPKILVDAPCSNSGVLRRRPDARWNWSEEKLAALVKLQAEILDRAAALLAPGGTLVYSTCSNEPEENQEQVKAFLARHPGFKLTAERESIPFESGHDGAYAASLLVGDSIERSILV